MLERILNKTETTRNRGKNKINKRNNLEVESFKKLLGIKETELVRNAKIT